MAKETERKFLLRNEEWKLLGTGIEYCQGYISTEKNATVRIRIIGDQGYLTIKGISTGASRSEYEYAIPVAEAKEMLDSLCHKPFIHKYRYKIPYEGFIWEVDEFLEENAGLVVAEIELEHEEQAFTKPSWVGEEVTQDHRYFNASLVKHPFSEWK